MKMNWNKIKNVKGIAGQIKEKMNDLKGLPKETLLIQHKNKMCKLQREWISKGDPLYDGEEFEQAMKGEWDRAGWMYTPSGMTFEEFLQASKEGIAEADEGSEGLEMSRTDKMIHKAVEKVGRNQKCPCGSGKKYKKCCGQYQ